MGGNSAAAPFVTGAIALLSSEFPDATAAEVKFAITRYGYPTQKTLVPPLLDAWAAYEVMAATHRKRSGL
jgi:subtilisin family serine protease